MTCFNKHNRVGPICRLNIKQKLTGILLLHVYILYSCSKINASHRSCICFSKFSNSCKKYVMYELNVVHKKENTKTRNYLLYIRLHIELK